MISRKVFNNTTLTFMLKELLSYELSELSSFPRSLWLVELKLFSHLTRLSFTTAILIADVTKQALLSYLG